jgi:hypothetical protein
VTTPTPTTTSDYVLVSGVVYKRIREIRPHRVESLWLRASIPPDCPSGRRSQWRPRYAEHKLPDHEVIDESRAKEIQAEGTRRLLDGFRAAEIQPIEQRGASR